MTWFRGNRFVSGFRSHCTRFFCVVVIAWGMGFLGDVQAESSPELAAMYGRGVHAYFANQADLAEQHFSQVIEIGSIDPRVHYFRAMARLQLGLQLEAEEDMRTGAALEARKFGNRHSISLALQRVQGPARRLLERYRRQARLDHEQQRRQLTRQRYEQLQHRETLVLRQKTPASIEPLVESPAELLVPDEDQPTPAAVAQPAVPSDANLPSSTDTQPPAVPADPTDEDPFAQPDHAEEHAEDSLDESDPLEQPSPLSEPDEVENDPLGDLDSSKEDVSESDTPAPSEEDDPFADPKPEPTLEEPTNTDVESVKAEEPPAAVPQPAEAGDGNLTDSDKVKPIRLLGVLGRVVGRMSPWRGIQMPSFKAPPGFLGPADVGSAEELELGPPEDAQPAEDPNRVETSDPPATADAEDPFGNSTDDDLFGDADDDPFADAKEADAEENSEPAPADSEESATAESSDDSQSEEGEAEEESTEEEDLFDEF